MTTVKTLLLCSCEGSMTLDPETAQAATGAESVRRVDRLCTGDLDVAAKALADGDTMIACAQMATLFDELAEDLQTAPALTTDIRDRAGWTADKNAHAKQAALLAAARLPVASTPTRDIISEGTCLILGASDVALPAADALADTLAITVLLSDAPDDLTPSGAYDIATGHIRSATGALSAFAVTVDRFATASPGGRGAARFSAPKDGATSTCDIILDLRGDGPLFPADHKRDGYVRADPGDPLATRDAIAKARTLQGVFEKPIYIRFDAHICAHSRASQTGCNRCIDVCPTGAITPNGDTVHIDPDICAGCGACAAVCPSGAASYDDPKVETLFARLRTLASTYRAAGGTAPRALFTDAEYGSEMIALSARFGRGLPADVIPVEVPNIEGVGHAETLAALAVGFSAVDILPTPRSDLAVPTREIALARAVAPEARITLLDATDPDALETALYGTAPDAPKIEPILPLGGRREVTRIAAAALNPTDTPIPLPGGAPYGAIALDSDACTLCLACVSLCPVGALSDNPDRPEVRFNEGACVQCGICASACPETAIALEPRLNLDKDALAPVVLHGEDPFECIECGKMFGVKSTIERIAEKLGGQHWMYADSAQTRMIQMCDTCRITAQYHQENSPFKGGQRPAVRTTQDYLDERDEN